MRTVVALIVLVVAAISARPAHAETQRERALRVIEVVEALALNDATMNKLMPAYSAYDTERQTLLAKQVDLLDRLKLVAAIDTAGAADKLLDDHLALQRALVTAETKFVGRLRKMLRADQARVARVILLAPVPVEPAATNPQPAKAPEDSLFPPGSDYDYRPTTPPKPCDPFAEMHGCRP